MMLPDLSLVTWRTSSRSSSGQNGQCVEVAPVADGVVLRDSKSRSTGPVLAFHGDQWAGFIRQVAEGGFDLA